MMQKKNEEHVSEVKKSKKDEIEKEILELTNKLNESNDKFIRLQAEYMNFRTRTATDIEKMFKYSNETLAVELLPIVDNFERAIKMDDNDLSDEVSKFLSGFKMIYTSFITTLQNIGVEEIVVEGKEFDPHIAEAVITENDTNKPANVVLEVLQKGYMYRDKVIRPAMVKVNK
jgi:molecular chaperone GrpE